MTRQGEITPWPTDAEKMRELILYSFRIQSDIDRAIRKKTQGNPWALLTIPAECREWLPEEYELYLRKQKNYILGEKK